MIDSFLSEAWQRSRQELKEDIHFHKILVLNQKIYLQGKINYIDWFLIPFSMFINTYVINDSFSSFVRPCSLSSELI